VTSIITDPISQGIGAPTATQDGIPSNCNNYAMGRASDDCVDFAKGRGITPDQFYSLNPVLGSAGANCGLQLWSSEYYCIGTSTVASTAATTTPSLAMAPDKDNCSNFAKPNDITTDQPYTWNTILGSNGENCNSLFWVKNIIAFVSHLQVHP
jgi:hypothetical protein